MNQSNLCHSCVFKKKDSLRLTSFKSPVAKLYILLDQNTCIIS